MFSLLVRVVNGPARFRAAMIVRCMSIDSGVPSFGSGSGKGGGSGGSVRESGGAFGVREAALEDQYFRRVSAQQLEELHDHFQDEIRYLQKQVKEQQAAIEIKKKRLQQLRETIKND